MKRIIEKENLAYNHMLNICDICKRCKGFKEETYIYDCKYNTDNKGLYSGLISNHMENFKCKYYKRNAKDMTHKLQSKKIKRYYKDTVINITYKQGKFKIRVTKEGN